MNYSINLDSIESAFNDVEDISELERTAAFSYYVSLTMHLNGSNVIPIGVAKETDDGVISCIFGAGTSSKDGSLNLSEQVTVDIIPNEQTLRCIVVQIASKGLIRDAMYKVIAADQVYQLNFISASSDAN